MNGINGTVGLKLKGFITREWQGRYEVQSVKGAGMWRGYGKDVAGCGGNVLDMSFPFPNVLI